MIVSPRAVAAATFSSSTAVYNHNMPRIRHSTHVLYEHNQRMLSSAEYFASNISTVPEAIEYFDMVDVYLKGHKAKYDEKVGKWKLFLDELPPEKAKLIRGSYEESSRVLSSTSLLEEFSNKCCQIILDAYQRHTPLLEAVEGTKILHRMNNLISGYSSIQSLAAFKEEFDSLISEYRQVLEDVWKEMSPDESMDDESWKAMMKEEFPEFIGSTFNDISAITSITDPMVFKAACQEHVNRSMAKSVHTMQGLWVPPAPGTFSSSTAVYNHNMTRIGHLTHLLYEHIQQMLSSAEYFASNISTVSEAIEYFTMVDSYLKDHKAEYDEKVGKWTLFLDKLPSEKAELIRGSYEESSKVLCTDYLLQEFSTDCWKIIQDAYQRHTPLLEGNTTILHQMNNLISGYSSIGCLAAFKEEIESIISKAKAKSVSTMPPLTKCLKVLPPEKPRISKKRKLFSVTSDDDDSIKTKNKQFKPSPQVQTKCLEVLPPEKPRISKKRKFSSVTSDDDDCIKTKHKQFKPSPRVQSSILGDVTNKQSTSTKHNSAQIFSIQSTSPKHAKKNCPQTSKQVVKKRSPSKHNIRSAKQMLADYRAKPKATGVAHAGPESLAIMMAQRAQVNQTLARTSKVAVEQKHLDFGVSNGQPGLIFGASNDAEKATPAADAAVGVETPLVHEDEELDSACHVSNDNATGTTDDIDAECSEGTVVGNDFPEPPQDEPDLDFGGMNDDASNDVEAEPTPAAAQVDFGGTDNVEAAEETADDETATPAVDASNDVEAEPTPAAAQVDVGGAEETAGVEAEVEVEAPPVVQPRVRVRAPRRAVRRVRMIRELECAFNPSGYWHRIGSRSR